MMASEDDGQLVEEEYRVDDGNCEDVQEICNKVKTAYPSVPVTVVGECVECLEATDSLNLIRTAAPDEWSLHKPNGEELCDLPPVSRGYMEGSEVFKFGHPTEFLLGPGEKYLMKHSSGRQIPIQIIDNRMGILAGKVSAI